MIGESLNAALALVHRGQQFGSPRETRNCWVFRGPWGTAAFWEMWCQM